MADKDEAANLAAAKTRAAAQPTTVVAATPASALAAPAPTGFFDEVKKLDDAAKATSSGQKHTFGAWARAKGVKPERIKQLVAEKKLDVSGFTGDGPEMTEEEFEQAVDFRLFNTFGELPVQKIHVSAEDARAAGNAPPLTEAQLAEAQASVDKGRRV